MQRYASLIVHIIVSAAMVCFTVVASTYGLIHIAASNGSYWAAALAFLGALAGAFFAIITGLKAIDVVVLNAWEFKREYGHDPSRLFPQ